MTLLTFFIAMAAGIVAWFSSIKYQVKKNHIHRVRRQPPPSFTNHTPSGGIARLL